MTWNHIAGWSLILAPVGQLGGWTLMRLGGNDGVEPQNTIAHTVWLLGFLFLAVVCAELYRRVASRGLGQWLARISLTVAMLSVLASIAEMISDLYVAYATDTPEQVRALSERITADPIVDEILFGVGTQFVYLGFLALIIQLAVLRRVSMTVMLLVLATLVLFVAYESVDGNGFWRHSLMPLAVGCWLAALAPLGWRLLNSAREPRRRTASAR